MPGSTLTGGVAPPRRGRGQRRRTKNGRARTPNLAHIYRYRMDPITPGDFMFHVSRVRRGRREKPLPLGKVCEEIGWVDEAAVLTGDIILRRPDPLVPSGVPVARGDRIRLRVRHSGKWYLLWTMRVAGEPEIGLTDGTVTAQLSDDLELLDSDERDWLFRKDKRHPKGWTADEGTRHVARVTGVRLGVIAKGHHRIKKLKKKKATGLDAIRALYAEESKDSARRFVVRLRNARLEVVAYARNTTLYVFGRGMEDVSITRTGRARPFTVIEGKARIGKGKSAKKITYTFQRKDIIARFGRVKQEKNYGRVDSSEELHRKVKRDYAKGLRTKPSVQIVMPGIPWLRRGEGVQVLLPAEGLKGAKSFMFTTRVAQRVSASGGYTMEVAANTTDPFEADRKRMEKELRDKKRKKRKRKKK